MPVAILRGREKAVPLTSGPTKTPIPVKDEGLTYAPAASVPGPGNRTKAVTNACKNHGGFYLGSIGGPAALLAKENIKKSELLEYPELGLEAVYKIDVVDFPAFILVDDKGNEFFAQLPVIG